MQLMITENMNTLGVAMKDEKFVKNQQAIYDKTLDAIAKLNKANQNIEDCELQSHLQALEKTDLKMHDFKFEPLEI